MGFLGLMVNTGLHSKMCGSEIYCVVGGICEMVCSRGDMKGTDSKRDQRSLAANELFVAEFI